MFCTHSVQLLFSLRVIRKDEVPLEDAMNPMKKLLVATVLFVSATVLSPAKVVAQCNEQEQWELCNFYHNEWWMENWNSCYAQAGLTFYETYWVCYFDENGCLTGVYGEGWCQQW
jgi:hypothetical protein